MAPIPVSSPGGRGLVAFVDKADHDRLARFRWELLPSGYVARRERHRGRRRVYYLQREVVGATHGDLLRVGHRNGNKLDNRRANLWVRPAVSSPPPAHTSAPGEEDWQPDIAEGRSPTLHRRAR